MKFSWVAALAGLWAGLAASGAWAAPPDLSGAWTLDRASSDDAAATVMQAVGPDATTSAVTLGNRVWAGQKAGALSVVPQITSRRDEGRVNLREYLLEMVRGMSRLAVEQDGAEVKTVHGEDGVRIFSLERETTGAGAGGDKVVRRARWEGERLTLESESGHTRLVEVLGLETGGRLSCALRYQAKSMSKPLELRFFYDRIASP